MNDFGKHRHLKETGSGGDEKRLSRRPMWRSLKMAANAGISMDPSGTAPTLSRRNTEQPDSKGEASLKTSKNCDDKAASIDDEKSRLSTWLSQQIYEYEKQTHYSPSLIDEREISTMSNLSLVSHVSSVNNNPADGSGIKRRPSSVPSSPTSITIPRLLLKPVEPTTPTPEIPSKDNNTPPLSPPTQRLISVTTATMIHPTSPTASTISVDRSSNSSTTSSPEGIMNGNSFGTLALPTNQSNDQEDEINSPSNNNEEEEEDDETFETASGSKSYSEYMDDRLDEINDNSSDSVYYINPNGITYDADLEYDDDTDNGNNKKGINKISYCTKNRTSSTQALYVNSVLDSMDPEVAQALLEWRRQSLLKIDWFDMFAVKSELWRSSTLFHLYLNQQDCQLSSKSSITTSIISLDYKGVSLDKAFRSYSSKIDYAKANVLDIDQALQVFSQLYWECNPSKLFRCAELVYIVIHSLMLLNTDVHAGQGHISMDQFCTSTIELILGHQASIPIMLFDEDGESTWHQTMVECLQSLYKSVKRSSLLPTDQQKVTSAIIDHQCHHQKLKPEVIPDPPQQKQQHQPISNTPKADIQLETAFSNLFISTATETPVVSAAPKKSTSTPQKKQKPNRRSNSLYSTPSWTLLRRRDTHRAKVGPYKEGPLSCQLNGEEWKICWVILHHGHLHIYHHRGSRRTTPPSILDGHTSTSSPSLSTTSLSSEANKNKKLKKKFMQHLTQSPIPAGENNNGHLLHKKEPYEEVDVYLGNTFCVFERFRPHAFSLQLMNGSTYLFDCGSEPQAALWIRDCNYWAARETKIVLPRVGLIRSLDTQPSSSSWKRPPPPAGASVLDKKGQQDAIGTYLLYLQNELKYHLQQPGWASSAWQDKKMYLEVEVKKYQCYQDSIHQQ